MWDTNFLMPLRTYIFHDVAENTNNVVKSYRDAACRHAAKYFPHARSQYVADDFWGTNVAEDSYDADVAEDLCDVDVVVGFYDTDVAKSFYDTGVT